MTEFTFLPPLLLTIGGLIIGALLKSLLRHTRIPYTVGLFAVGLLLGLINRYGFFDFLPSLSDAVRSVADINPDLILYLFLPILIFDAAYELNLHIFRKTLANTTLLAVPGLVICMFLTAALLMGIGTVFPAYSSWTWTCALMFGALISATDPVAVVALLHELKTSKRFSTLVDAESLLNDGTGIVCFMLFFGALTSPEYHNTSPPIGIYQSHQPEFRHRIHHGQTGYLVHHPGQFTGDDSEQRHHPIGLRHLHSCTVLPGSIGRHCTGSFRADHYLYRKTSFQATGQRVHGTILGAPYLHRQYPHIHHCRNSHC